MPNNGVSGLQHQIHEFTKPFHQLNGYVTGADLPTFYEIKAEVLPPFGKTRGRFLCSENIVIFDLPVAQNELIFSVLTSPNSTEITKLVLNNNTSICLCMYLL